MGSKAWTADGDVKIIAKVPFGAIRKAVFKYGDVVKTLAKLTFVNSNTTYDFEKQAKEGVVVIAPDYAYLTFFLPEDREPMTPEQCSTMTIREYIEMLATTDYANIPAWDRFVQYIAKLMETLEDPYMDFEYEIGTGYNGNTWHGVGSFGGISKFRTFMSIINDTLTHYTFTAGDEQESQKLSYWSIDGVVELQFTIILGSDSVSYRLKIGKK